MRRLAPLLVAPLALALAPAAHVRGQDLFSVTATTTDPFPFATTVTQGDSSVVDLVRDVIETRDEFAPLLFRDFSASLTYAGVQDAILFDVNAGGTQATLRFPDTGFSRTFTAANRDELEDEIEDFIKEDGADAYSEFL